jgi:hypothetical protein
MPDALTRRSFLTGVAGAAAAVIGLSQAAGAQTPARGAQARPTLVTYKDANCGCCHKWVEYMQGKGYRVFAHDTDINAIKQKYGIAPSLQSCHTTIVDGLIIEGHVPEGDMVRLLRERPAGVVGLTIPGMPASAPGMDVLPFQPYTVLAFDKAGKTTVFQRHTKPE